MIGNSAAEAEVDVVIVGAGPVGLMCAYLGQLSGLRTVILDSSTEPLQIGRADALNARTLQLLEIVGLFADLYPQGKPCNTSSVWRDGGFLSRQSTWWDALEGCFHKHFLMLGQAFVEQLLDSKLSAAAAPVRRSAEVVDVQIMDDHCLTTLASGEVIRSSYLVGADGSRSLVRRKLEVPFEIARPEITWAVLDGVIETDFPKVPEIITFQADTSDVAWIPREGKIDRFYVRMDKKEFTFDEVLGKINRAVQPHSVRFTEMVWQSQFSVKESVAESFIVADRAFLAGDASHIHSVNGGQGLNTGLADAFNLVWKLAMVINHGAPPELLQSYQDERKPVAISVVGASGELVRSTKYSDSGSHAEDYVKIVEKRAGNITGMGIRYGEEGLAGTRLFDAQVFRGSEETRLYSLLDYTKFTLLVFAEEAPEMVLPPFVKLVTVGATERGSGYWSPAGAYSGQALLVRPDSYIESFAEVNEVHSLLSALTSLV